MLDQQRRGQKEIRKLGKIDERLETRQRFGLKMQWTQDILDMY